MNRTTNWSLQWTLITRQTFSFGGLNIFTPVTLYTRSILIISNEPLCVAPSDVCDKYVLGSRTGTAQIVLVAHSIYSHYCRVMTGHPRDIDAVIDRLATSVHCTVIHFTRPFLATPNFFILATPMACDVKSSLLVLCWTTYIPTVNVAI